MKKNIKIAIVGAGIGGIASALVLNSVRNIIGFFEIDIYFDPNEKIEKVGQGSTLPISNLISEVLDSDFIENTIDSTIKTGILYENWGKKNNLIYHKFPLGSYSLHYNPSSLSKKILESGYFNVIEKNITNLDDVDANYIIDCRGKKYNSENDYYDIINPTNSALISRKSIVDRSFHYTKCVATPNGWTFVIPNIDSMSYGYLYNGDITNKQDAIKNFESMFDLKVDFSLNFNNYVAKDVWYDDRTILNGNRYSFIEPLEATSIGIYSSVAIKFADYLSGKENKIQMNDYMLNLVKKIETFILWHYQYGSKYNTPFWDYAKTLNFFPDSDFFKVLDYSKQNSIQKIHSDLRKYNNHEYAQWSPLSFKNWIENVI